MRQYGGDLDSKLKNFYIRPCLALPAVLAHRQTKVQAGKLILKFMRFAEYVHSYKQKLFITLAQIKSIQNIFRSRFLAHSAKMKMLLSCWNRTLSDLQIQAQQKGDK